jgi:DNA-binding transcriptional regulator YiaG
MTGHEFHRIIKYLRLSNKETAQLFDVSTRTVQRWSNDERMPVPGSVASALRAFVLLTRTQYDFRAVSKINFLDFANL